MGCSPRSGIVFSRTQDVGGRLYSVYTPWTLQGDETNNQGSRLFAGIGVEG
jgi:hypothetical protein